MDRALTRPRLAVVAGDPAGIGPELVARLLADPLSQQAELLLVADPTVLADGMAVAGARSALAPVGGVERGLGPGTQPALLALPLPGPVARAQSSAAGGRHCLDALRIALQAVRGGHADALLFAPLNKHSLHLAGMDTADELHWFARELGHGGPTSEFNVMDGLWTSRVTSHIALREVAERITPERITQAIELILQAVQDSGVAQPRIAVCGLNPHNGDNGSFGREELDVIGPTVQAARARGLPVDGPFAADTIFLKVQGPDRDHRAYDGIVTMYHDQGQIAMKLMGFQRGVTVQGGLPVPIATPAHGTAFDIAGQGRAHPGAMLQAFGIACGMARSRIATRA
ncbi:MAG: 4-hydroxythreonine-4-phosphate dehydrogenase PdxA [Rubrivivax sp.]